MKVRNGAQAYISPKIGVATGRRLQVTLDLVVRDAKGKVTGRFRKRKDLMTFQFTQAYAGALWNVGSQTMKDTGGTSRSVSSQSAGSSPSIEFGTGTTAAAYADNAIQTAAGGTNPVAVTQAVPTSGANTWTYNATWTNTTAGSVTISEVATYMTIATFTFAVTHDVFTGVVVSVNGTCQATYTLTMT